MSISRSAKKTRKHKKTGRTIVRPLICGIKKAPVEGADLSLIYEIAAKL